MRKGFTLIEILVVIGIIAVLIAATAGAFSKMTKSADKAKCQELVSNVSTALVALFQADGVWPKALRTKGATDGFLDDRAAYPLAKGGYLSLTVENGKLAGLDKFGILSPWGAAHVKRKGNAASLGDAVGLGTLQEHLLHYALDLDGNGIIEGANVGGETVDIRANVAVWCCGKDGKLEPYSRGLRSDDVYSWTKGQTVDVK